VLVDAVVLDKPAAVPPAWICRLIRKTAEDVGTPASPGRVVVTAHVPPSTPRRTADDVATLVLPARLVVTAYAQTLPPHRIAVSAGTRALLVRDVAMGHVKTWPPMQIIVVPAVWSAYTAGQWVVARVGGAIVPPVSSPARRPVEETMNSAAARSAVHHLTLRFAVPPTIRGVFRAGTVVLIKAVASVSQAVEASQ